MTAMRCAGLLSKLQQSGEQIDRSGQGKVVEIYPAASMRIWGLQISGYRVAAPKREALLGQLLEKAQWLEVSGFRDLMVTSCDAFDAVIAALAAAAAALGHSTKPPANKLSQAQIEGWVALPIGSLESLR
jgi:hypothetical protein